MEREVLDSDSWSGCVFLLGQREDGIAGGIDAPRSRGSTAGGEGTREQYVVLNR